MTKLLKILAGVGIVSMMSASANAATFDFDDKTRWSKPSFTLTSSDGLSVTVSGGEYSNGGKKVRTDNGFGLSVGRHMIDTNEYAMFKFSHDVTLDSFSAGYVDKYDDYRIYALIGGSFSKIQYGDFGATNRYGYNSNQATVATNASAGAIVSRFFAIGVDDKWDEFKIRDITANRVSEVPLPAGGALLLSGFGLLALRRKKS